MGLLFWYSLGRDEGTPRIPTPSITHFQAEIWTYRIPNKRRDLPHWTVNLCMNRWSLNRFRSKSTLLQLHWKHLTRTCCPTFSLTLCKKFECPRVIHVHKNDGTVLVIHSPLEYPTTIQPIGAMARLQISFSCEGKTDIIASMFNPAPIIAKPLIKYVSQVKLSVWKGVTHLQVQRVWNVGVLKPRDT
jgi:hypothetical protein